MEPYDKVKGWGEGLIKAFRKRVEMECSPEMAEEEMAYAEHLKTRLSAFLELINYIDWEIRDYWDDSASRIATRMDRAQPMGRKDLDAVTDMCELFLELLGDETDKLNDIRSQFDEYQTEKYSCDYNFGEI